MTRAFVIGLGSILIAVLIVFAALRQRAQRLVTTVATPRAPAVASDLGSVPRMALGEAKQHIESRSATVIDVRDADSYIAGHIPGALQIPLSRIEGEVHYLPRERPIITYCT